jgi:hypothetical protein
MSELFFLARSAQEEPPMNHLRSIHTDRSAPSDEELLAVAESTPSRLAEKPLPIHPAWLRVTHWLNVVAVAVMVGSGWRVYNAAPVFDFRFPGDLTMGGWLGGALRWHFAGMWYGPTSSMHCTAGSRMPTRGTTTDRSGWLISA